MVLLKRILILEDNLLVLSKLLAELEVLEQDQPYSFSLVILTEAEQVEEYINNNPKANFDIILLDRDCKFDGTFHVLDLERFGAEKVISMSSVEEYNEDAKRRGVSKTVLKDIRDYDAFAKSVSEIIRTMIS